MCFRRVLFRSFSMKTNDRRKQTTMDEIIRELFLINHNLRKHINDGTLTCCNDFLEQMMKIEFCFDENKFVDNRYEQLIEWAVENRPPTLFTPYHHAVLEFYKNGGRIKKYEGHLIHCVLASLSSNFSNQEYTI